MVVKPLNLVENFLVWQWHSH